MSAPPSTGQLHPGDENLYKVVLSKRRQGADETSAEGHGPQMLPEAAERAPQAWKKDLRDTTTPTMMTTPALIKTGIVLTVNGVLIHN